MLEQISEAQENETQTAESALTRWRETEARTTQMLPQQEIETWLGVIQKEAQQRRKMRSVMRGALFLFGSMMALFAVVTLWRGFATGHWNFDLFSQIGLISCFTAAAGFSGKYKEAAGKLADCDDVRVIGPLVETLESQDKDLIAIAESALVRLLPRLQYSDRSLLTTEQRDLLNLCLRRAHKETNAELLRAILKAYEQVGDEKALPVVEKLANGDPPALDATVQQAAQDCLPFLRETVARQQASSSLLRASSAEDAHPETLLRPALHSAETPAEELLRASAPPQNT